MSPSPFQIPGFPDYEYGSIFCIGRNYAKHAAEMNSPLPDTPVVFLKPRNSIIHNGDKIHIPAQSENVHHEVELAVLIGEKAENISEKEALSVVKAFGVSLDITARDLQSEAKKAGLPWSLAKGFKTFTPIGNLLPYTETEDLQNLDIQVRVNGDIRQNGNTRDMIFPVKQLISYLSQNFTLYSGDLILTGTPEGVSQLLPGDHISAAIGNERSTLEVHVEN